MDTQPAEKDLRAKLARKHDETAPDTDSSAANPIVDLQRMVGNREVQRLLAQRKISAAPSGSIQAKLTVGAPDDVYEQEADSVAHQVMTMPAEVQRDEAAYDDNLALKRIQRDAANLDDDDLKLKPIQRDAANLDDDDLKLKPLQRSAAGGVPDVPDETEGQIESMRGGGQTMPDNARSFFEPRFGQDFSSVNVHTGAQADSLNRQLEARAFTTGSDIFFRSGEYNPESSSGRELLAHELTHVVQQGGSQAQRKTEDCEDC